MGDIALLRVLHVAGAVLLLGNVTVTGVWAAYLYRARDRVPFQPVARAILWTDLIFTIGGGTLLTVSGILLALRRGYRVTETPWLLHGIASLGAATLLWLLVLLPAQLRMERAGQSDGDALGRAFRRWSVVGWTATGLLYYGLWAMAGRGGA
ncbi:MAG TPA: DUF2269 family protein [Gemmatimonadales bacterium]|nr:DUF2269 family protein [Gemmatimonadales bacterium]